MIWEFVPLSMMVEVGKQSLLCAFKSPGLYVWGFFIAKPPWLEQKYA